MKCPTCNAETRPGDNFCLACGTKLTLQSGQASVSPSPAYPVAEKDNSLSQFAAPPGYEAAARPAASPPPWGPQPNYRSSGVSGQAGSAGAAQPQAPWGPQPNYGQVGPGAPQGGNVPAAPPQAPWSQQRQASGVGGPGNATDRNQNYSADETLPPSAFGMSSAASPVSNAPTPAKMQLAIKLPGEEPRTIPLEGESFSLGRAPSCTIVINDKMVSRRHTIIEKQGENFVIIDQNSANGTFVNDNQISKPVTLRSGDRIGIGDAELIFSSVIDQSPAAVESDDALTHFIDMAKVDQSKSSLPETKSTVRSDQPPQDLAKQLQGTGPLDLLNATVGEAPSAFEDEAVTRAVNPGKETLPAESAGSSASKTSEGPPKPALPHMEDNISTQAISWPPPSSTPSIPPAVPPVDTQPLEQGNKEHQVDQVKEHPSPAVSPASEALLGLSSDKAYPSPAWPQVDTSLPSGWPPSGPTVPGIQEPNLNWPPSSLGTPAVPDKEALQRWPSETRNETPHVLDTLPPNWPPMQAPPSSPPGWPEPFTPAPPVPTGQSPVSAVPDVPRIEPPPTPASSELAATGGAIMPQQISPATLNEQISQATAALSRLQQTVNALAQNNEKLTASSPAPNNIQVGQTRPAANLSGQLEPLEKIVEQLQQENAYYRYSDLTPMLDEAAINQWDTNNLSLIASHASTLSQLIRTHTNLVEELAKTVKELKS